MSKPTSFEVSKDLFLVEHVVAKTSILAPPPPPPCVHHIWIVDISGSMSWEIPQLADHLKSQLITLVGENDTVSLIWFSGRGEFGIVFENRKVREHKDQIEINNAIDRWLRPVGMTAFVQPIQLAGEVAQRIVSKTPGNVALLFMSDGWDNCWPRDVILNAVKTTAAHVSSAVVVEYGNYADRQMLTKMAETFGGSIMFARDFESYRPIFETSVRRKSPKIKKTTLTLDVQPINGVVFAVENDVLSTFSVDPIPTGAGVSVPSHLPWMYYLSTTPVGKVAKLSEAVAGGDPQVLQAAYAAMAIFGQRVQPQIVWNLLRVLGDVSYIDEFSKCFGPQRYTAFVQRCTNASITKSDFFSKGRDTNRVPREDAPTILDVMEVLQNDPHCRVLTQSDAWSYTRIGRKMISKTDYLTVTEGKEMAELGAALANSREVAVLRKTVDRINELMNRGEKIKFHLDKTEAEKGYPIDDLTWNQTMANLSFRVKKFGYILTSEIQDMPKEVRDVLPEKIRTYVYGQYAVVKDALQNQDTLPVRISKASVDTLTALGVITPNDPVVPTEDGLFQVVLDLRPLPIINAKMVKSVSAKEMAQAQWNLLLLKGRAKVFKHYKPERKSTGFATIYGDAAATWLDEHGITDHSGYKSDDTTAPSGDVYLAKELRTAIKGFSSLSSVDIEDVRERMANEEKIKKDASLAKGKGKLKGLNPIHKLVTGAIREVDAFLASDVYKTAADKDSLFQRWIDDKARAATIEEFKLRRQVSRGVFAIIVGQCWFSEFASLDEHTLKLKVVLDGEPFEADVDFVYDTMKEVKI